MRLHLLNLFFIFFSVTTLFTANSYADVELDTKNNTSILVSVDEILNTIVDRENSNYTSNGITETICCEVLDKSKKVVRPKWSITAPTAAEAYKRCDEAAKIDRYGNPATDQTSREVAC